MKSADITGQKFGKLTAIEIVEKRNGREYWLCKCDCEENKTKIVRKSHLTKGRIRSCGCMYKGKRRGISGPNTYVFVDEYVIGQDFKGNRFFFDREDYELIAPYNWYLNHDGYVVARIKQKNVTMHRFLLGDECAIVDHGNNDRADNRRRNLRAATNSDNGANRKGPCVDKQVIGVYQRRRYEKFEAAVVKDGVRNFLGFYDEYEDAVRARLKGEAKFFGEFAPQKHLFEQYGIKLEELNV